MLRNKIKKKVAAAIEFDTWPTRWNLSNMMKAAPFDVHCSSTSPSMRIYGGEHSSHRITLGRFHSISIELQCWVPPIYLIRCRRHYSWNFYFWKRTTFQTTDFSYYLTNQNNGKNHPFYCWYQLPFEGYWTTAWPMIHKQMEENKSTCLFCGWRFLLMPSVLLHFLLMMFSSCWVSFLF